MFFYKNNLGLVRREMLLNLLFKKNMAWQKWMQVPSVLKSNFKDMEFDGLKS